MRLTDIYLGLSGGHVMAKAAPPPPANLPHVPEHLHVTLPSGQKVHPQSPEGIQHLTDTVTQPAKAHADVLHDHLEGLMKGLDVKVKVRTKEPGSLAEKIVRKNKPAHQMGDIIGGRVTVNNPAHFGEAQRRLQAHMDSKHPMSGQDGIHIKDEEDNCKTPMASGYRSVHYNAHTKGVGTEIQLRQPHHTVWADYMHDKFYKDHDLKSSLEQSGHAHEFEHVKTAGQAYGKQVAEHLESTNGKKGPDAPKTPALLQKHGLEFPWHKLP